MERLTSNIKDAMDKKMENPLDVLESDMIVNLRHKIGNKESEILYSHR